MPPFALIIDSTSHVAVPSVSLTRAIFLATIANMPKQPAQSLPRMSWRQWRIAFAFGQQLDEATPGQQLDTQCAAIRFCWLGAQVELIGPVVDHGRRGGVGLTSRVVWDLIARSRSRIGCPATAPENVAG